MGSSGSLAAEFGRLALGATQGGHVDNRTGLDDKGDKVDDRSLENDERDRPGDQPKDTDKGLPEAVSNAQTEKRRKKKRSKPAKVAGASDGGCIPAEQSVVVPEESPEQALYWSQELRKLRPTVHMPLFGLLDEKFRPNLDIFLTPSCRSFELHTPRLILRRVRPDAADHDAIARIKTEPIVQKTQLAQIRDHFQSRYVRMSMPRASNSSSSSWCFRTEYVFAITLKDPSSVAVGNGVGVSISNRLRNAEGYLGNFGLDVAAARSLPDGMRIRKGREVTRPTFKQCEEAQLVGSLFYELHPQVWGRGLAGEAFTEVLRFAIEELGCVKVYADPTVGNEASIKMCVRNGLKYSHTGTDNPYRKPQLFHSITRDEWFLCNRPEQDAAARDPWGSKEVCRWCLNFRLERPPVQCEGCSWARYCSRECQRAQWVQAGGHQAECDMLHDQKGP